MAETIGWLTDKIIVTELKIYHMREQTERADVEESHREMCRARLQVLQVQRDDLKDELSELFRQTAAGKVRPKLYRQFKMYNDPRFRTPNAK